MLSGDAGVEALAGIWNGYVELLTFPESNSDAISLTFGQDPTDGISGTVVFGSAPPPPPATDGNASYPSNFDAGSQLQLGDVVEGFLYTATRFSFDGTRLRFSLDRAEPWKGWCALQRSYQLGPAACESTPPWGGRMSQGVCTYDNPNTGAAVPVPCSLFDRFGPDPCYCSAAGCTVDLSQADFLFDLQLTPNKLDGSMSGPYNVHFTRAP